MHDYARLLGLTCSGKYYMYLFKYNENTNTAT
jgi:hypothetical protein